MTKIIWQDTTGSTNDDAKQLAQKGEFGPLWIGAAQQTKGRGRRGRSWQSPEGNLYASWLAQHEYPLDVAAQYSFVAALAVAEMARHYLPPERAAALQFKWPNDVLLAGRKFCGILIESGRDHNRLWLVVGIGVNLVHFPEDAQFPATALGLDATPQEALAKLAETFEKTAKIWNGQFANIRDTWLSNAAGLGEHIDVRLAEQTLSGVFEGINQNGVLILALADGSKRMIEAGDVFFKKTNRTKNAQQNEKL